MPEAAIGLGSNLGDKAANLKHAVEAIAATPGITLRATSAVYRTSPWGRVDQDTFLNACIIVETSLAPRELLAVCRKAEDEGGRDRGTEERWGPRKIDADILLYGDRSVNEADLVIPHPRMTERAFVLVPLACIAPDWRIDGVTVRERAEALGRDGVEEAPEARLF
ncbi:2-amino-4-hydroxy-6-hydroxymethyldihydropteridine diphosphokinase [Terrihabitans rhizophilus]|uniref:2-amino-4-hydroxy-6-hydroxymethyldihydropteridine pyrophosphokinase n=1 Tax=Terrihabitans rhizophilus TaxID=3092662 RepID=A0ABU4RSB0_9HYPH|nr:2-amino-4-hydroxy-6-hydroxymethyldihydropteridine diphosphokinase [Terrihabitans sp. PJ23]MDX6806535.1 2-amino-4-hydroxy-6-hydroxymethyldihydropteridine diphosphokinase [Terrihabitans sp. PJ23]